MGTKTEIGAKYWPSNTRIKLTAKLRKPNGFLASCSLSAARYADCPLGSSLGGKMFDSDICKKKDSSPLKTYESEYEAQEAIEYVKRQYGNEQVKKLV